MRANGLSDSTIYAGEQYVMPSSADYAASTGELGQAALNQDNVRIAGNRTDLNQPPLPNAGVDLEVNVNLDFLHPDIPDSRAESMRMMDHGLMDAQRQEQLKNIAPITGAINDWWEGVKGRASLSISDPLKALDQGLSNSFPFYDALGQVSQEELSQAVNRVSSEDGKLDLNPQAFDELLGSLPISGVAGTTKRIFDKAAKGITNKISLTSVDDILTTSTGNDVAFGIQKSLKDFTKKSGANSYYAWTKKGLSAADPMKRGSFVQAFTEATSNSDRIIFNLDGLNVQRAYKLGQSGPFDLPRNVTNWEFVNVLPNPKTIFLQNGKVIPLENVLQRAGQ